jgi:hypothetical protein
MEQARIHIHDFCSDVFHHNEEELKRLDLLSATARKQPHRWDRDGAPLQAVIAWLAKYSGIEKDDDADNPLLTMEYISRAADGGYWGGLKHGRKRKRKDISAVAARMVCFAEAGGMNRLLAYFWKAYPQEAAEMKLPKPAGPTPVPATSADANATKAQPWSDDAPEYIPNKDAVNLACGDITLKRLGQLCQPNGSFRYMRKGRRTKVHVGDFRQFLVSWRAKYRVADDASDEEIQTALSEERKLDPRR